MKHTALGNVENSHRLPVFALGNSAVFWQYFLPSSYIANSIASYSIGFNSKLPAIVFFARQLLRPLLLQ